MSEITIRDITRDNIYKCIGLKLAEEQKERIAPNVYSIAESKVIPNYRPLAIYLDEEMIGFVMIDYDPVEEEKNKYWVPRFMIDVRYQRMGYGKKAMEQVIHMLRGKEDCKYIRLSTEPDNTPAVGFYKSLGFVDTGEMLEESEVILELIVKK